MKKKLKKRTKKTIKVKVSQKTKNLKSKPIKNPVAYFGCMQAFSRKGIKPQNITQVAHECKTNALAINAKISKQKAQAVKKIQKGYHQLGKGLDEFIRSK